MILTNSTLLNCFLCNYNWHGKDPNSTAKNRPNPYTQVSKTLVLKNELLHYTRFSLKSQFFVLILFSQQIALAKLTIFYNTACYSSH